MAIYPCLKDRTVLISGGGGGIGAAMVEAFSAQGAQVCFIDLEAGEARKLSDSLVAQGLPAPLYEICDLRDIPAMQAAVERLIARNGPMACLINNAGNDQAQAWSDVRPEDWDDRVAVNLRHQFFLAQAIAPGMMTLKGGSIINLGSISWKIGARGVPVYAVMKSAVWGLTKTLARELGEFNIRVNQIDPGWVLTKRQLAKGANDPQKFTDYLTKQCLKTHLQPVDIAKMALWLASDESRLCTGQVFTVDAGAS